MYKVELIVFLNIQVKSQVTFRGDYETGITGSNTWSGLQTAAAKRFFSAKLVLSQKSLNWPTTFFFVVGVFTK